MNWLLGGSATAGVIGTIVLAIYIARMARNSRVDLFKLITVIKDLAETRRDIDGYRRTIEDLEDVLSKRTQERNRAHKARRVIEEQLFVALEQLSIHRDSAGVVATIRSNLKRLSKMSTVSAAETPEDHPGSKTVHGTVSGGAGETGEGN